MIGAGNSTRLPGYRPVSA